MLNIDKRLIPISSKTPNYIGELTRDCDTYITIHETSLGTDYASDDRKISYYANRLLNPPEGVNKRIGYHFIVSDTQK